MKRIKQRLVERYQILKTHPVTKDREWAGLVRYIKFHFLASVFRQIKYNWIGPLKFLVSKGDAGLVGNIYYGLYEFEESIFLLHLFRSNDLFLDVGANLGHYSLLASGMCLTKSIAVEPVPETVAKLKEQVALNNLEHLINVKQLGVADKCGELWITNDRGSMNRIVDDHYSNAISVEVSTIDTFLNGEIPLAIKIDVEGYEWFALQGAKHCLNEKQLKVLILELNNSSKTYHIKDRDVYNLVLEYGFKPYRYEAQHRKLLELLDYNKDRFNTIFIRDEPFVAERLKSAKAITIMNRTF